MIFLSVVGISSFYLVVTIGLDFIRLKQNSSSGFHDFGLFDWWVKERIVEVMIYWWVISFGASVGSFLNVVVYRMPLGMSLSAKSSHCVWCKAKIFSRDNLPIIGWLLLRGRCRKCRLPISGRYPLVEAQTALLGLVMFIAMVQVRNFGVGPLVTEGVHWHFWLMNTAPIAQLIFYFYLFWLLAFCISVAWIDYDKNKVPWKLIFCTLVAAIAVPTLVLLVGKPYLERQFQSALEIQFASPALMQWELLNSLDGASFGIRNRVLFETFCNQITGAFVGLLSGFCTWFLFDTAFPVRTVESTAEMSENTGAAVEVAEFETRNGLVSILAVFLIAGLFCGPIFAALLAAVSFLTSVVSTTVLMNSRLSPLRTRWFFLPYSLVVSFIFWRMAESIWIR